MPRAELASVVWVELRVPTTARVVDEVLGREVPELAIPGLVLHFARDLKQGCTRRNAFSDWPPVLVRIRRRAIKVHCVAEAARLSVPADGDGTIEQLSGN